MGVENQANIYIKNITNHGDYFTFDVRFCDGDIITYNNTNTLPVLTNAEDKIITNGAIEVLTGNSVTFEAANEIQLNPGFIINLGGLFEMSINGCGD